MQAAQRRGCLTTAHSVAMLAKLAMLAGPHGNAQDARQLGAELLGFLHSRDVSLSPGLRAVTGQAAAALGLQAAPQQPSGATAPGPPGLGSGPRPGRQFPEAGPRATGGGRGRGQGRGGGRGSPAGAAAGTGGNVAAAGERDAAKRTAGSGVGGNLSRAVTAEGARAQRQQQQQAGKPRAQAPQAPAQPAQQGGQTSATSQLPPGPAGPAAAPAAMGNASTSASVAAPSGVSAPAQAPVTVTAFAGGTSAAPEHPAVSTVSVQEASGPAAGFTEAGVTLSSNSGMPAQAQPAPATASAGASGVDTSAIGASPATAAIATPAPAAAVSGDDGRLPGPSDAVSPAPVLSQISTDDGSLAGGSTFAEAPMAASAAASQQRPPAMPSALDSSNASTGDHARAVANSGGSGDGEPSAPSARAEVQAAGEPPAPSAAPAPGLPPLREALRMAWQLHAQQQEAQQRPPQQRGDTSAASGGATGSGAGPLTADAAARLEEALQQQAPDSMAVGDIAEVLQLLAELRLMPRYDWLTAARRTLEAAAAAAEAEAAEAEANGDAGGVAAATRAADLRVVHEVAGELLQLCWEADADRQQTGGGERAREQGRERGELHGDEQPQARPESSVGSGAAGPDGTAYSPAGQEGFAARVSAEGSEAGEAACLDSPAASPASRAPATPEVAPVRDEAGPAAPPMASANVSADAAQTEPQAEEVLVMPLARAQPGDWDEDGAALGRGAEPDAALQRLLSELTAARGGAPRPADNGAAAVATAGATRDAAVRAAIADLAQLLSEALRAEQLAAGRLYADAHGAGSIHGGAAAAASSPAMTAERVASLVSAAGALHRDLPAPLLASAVRLLVGMERGSVSTEAVAAVAAACVAAGFRPPEAHLEQLAALAFAAAPQTPSPSPSAPDAASPGLSASEVAADGGGAAAEPDEQAAAEAWAQAASVRTLHLAAHSLLCLGTAINNRQFAVWAEAAARRPRALSPSQLAQLLEACYQRGFRLRGAGVDSDAAALLAAALSPPARLTRLSAAEAAAVARFAAQQGLPLGSGGGAAAAGATLLGHLAPRLRELPPAELAELLPALRAAGAPLAAPAATAATSWLDAHSAALLPVVEELAPEQLLPLLRCYVGLAYAPPPMLLLGVSLALEAGLPSAPVPALLECLELLLCRLGFPPNEGLAAALRDDFLLRLMLAATSPPPAAAAPASGLSARQRLCALDVLAAARVRPHPAQLAALVDVEFGGLAPGGGSMPELSGEELARLLWHCGCFRGLPSWRFVGEWLQASAAALRQGDGGGGGGGGMSPGALARAGWVLAQMGVQPDRAWQAEYRAALLGAMPALDGEALSLAAHALLGMRGKPDAQWLEALEAAAAGRMAQLDAPSAVRLLHFVATAEMAPGREWMQSFFLHTLRYLEPASPSAAGRSPGAARLSGASAPLSPDQLVLLLRALSRLGFRPPEPWLAAALEALRRGAAALSPACFPLALSALARLCPDVASQLGPGSAVDALVAAAHEQRERFAAVELRWLLDTLGCDYPAYEVPAGAEANLRAALRWREAAGGAVAAEGHGVDVAEALGDAVSEEWLRWPRWK